MTSLVPGELVIGGQVLPGLPNAGNQGIQSSQSLTEGLLKAIAGVDSVQILASAGNDIDVISARNIEIVMDDNIANLKYSVKPTRNLRGMILSFYQSIGAKQCTFDPAYFRGGFDQGIPVLTGTINTTEYSGWLWNDRDQIYDCVSFLRTYTP